MPYRRPSTVNSHRWLSDQHIAAWMISCNAPSVIMVGTSSWRQMSGSICRSSMRSVAISQAGGAEGRRFRFMRRVSQCRGLGGIAGRREERGQVHYRADWLGGRGRTKGNGGVSFGRAIRLIAPVPVAAGPIADLFLTVNWNTDGKGEDVSVG